MKQSETFWLSVTDYIFVPSQISYMEALTPYVMAFVEMRPLEIDEGGVLIIELASL